jgi:hypothetical protein
MTKILQMLRLLIFLLSIFSNANADDLDNELSHAAQQALNVLDVDMKFDSDGVLTPESLWNSYNNIMKGSIAVQLLHAKADLLARNDLFEENSQWAYEIQYLKDFKADKDTLSVFPLYKIENNFNNQKVPTADIFSYDLIKWWMEDMCRPINPGLSHDTLSKKAYAMTYPTRIGFAVTAGWVVEIEFELFAKFEISLERTKEYSFFWARDDKNDLGPWKCGWERVNNVANSKTVGGGASAGVSNSVQYVKDFEINVGWNPTGKSWDGESYSMSTVRAAEASVSVGTGISLQGGINGFGGFEIGWAKGSGNPNDFQSSCRILDGKFDVHGFGGGCCMAEKFLWPGCIANPPTTDALRYYLLSGPQKWISQKCSVCYMTKGATKSISKKWFNDIDYVSVMVGFGYSVGAGIALSSPVSASFAQAHINEIANSFAYVGLPPGHITGGEICIKRTTSYSGIFANPTECADCSAGLYETSPTTCEYCSTGRYQSQSDQTSCLDCVAGKISKVLYTLQKAGNECGSSDTFLGTFDTVQKCAEKCIEIDNCEYFVYGKGERSGKCYHEETADIYCSEGWISNLYDFYSTNIRGRNACDSCPYGKYSNTASDECYECPAGTYQDQSGQGTCKTCPDGFYQTEKGKQSCKGDCLAGHHIQNKIEPVHTDNECGSSDTFLGTFDTLQECAEKCIETVDCEYFLYGKGARSRKCYHEKTTAGCPEGWLANDYDFYSTADIELKNECNNCPAGYSQSTAGQFTCDICQEGFYAERQELPNCKECTYGQYSDHKGTDYCTKCSVGKYLETTGAISDTKCKDCLINEYGPVEGLKFCLQCELGQYKHNMVPIVCTQCPSGYFQHFGENATKLDGMKREFEIGFNADLNLIDGSHINNVEDCILAAKSYEDKQLQEIMNRDSCKDWTTPTTTCPTSYQDWIALRECCYQSESCPSGRHVEQSNGQYKCRGGIVLNKNSGILEGDIRLINQFESIKNSLNCSDGGCQSSTVPTSCTDGGTVGYCVKNGVSTAAKTCADGGTLTLSGTCSTYPTSCEDASAQLKGCVSVVLNSTYECPGTFYDSKGHYWYDQYELCPSSKATSCTDNGSPTGRRCVNGYRNYSRCYWNTVTQAGCSKDIDGEKGYWDSHYYKCTTDHISRDRPVNQTECRYRINDNIMGSINYEFDIFNATYLRRPDLNEQNCNCSNGVSFTSFGTSKCKYSRYRSLGLQQTVNDCAKQCKEYSGCLYFRYNVASKHCYRIFGAVFDKWGSKCSSISNPTNFEFTVSIDTFFEETYTIRYADYCVSTTYDESVPNEPNCRFERPYQKCAVGKLVPAVVRHCKNGDTLRPGADSCTNDSKNFVPSTPASCTKGKLLPDLYDQYLTSYPTSCSVQGVLKLTQCDSGLTYVNSTSTNSNAYCTSPSGINHEILNEDRVCRQSHAVSTKKECLTAKCRIYQLVKSQTNDNNLNIQLLKNIKVIDERELSNTLDTNVAWYSLQMSPNHANKCDIIEDDNTFNSTVYFGDNETASILGQELKSKQVYKGTDCIECDFGKYSKVSSSQCLNCPVDTYNYNQFFAQCNNCPVDFTTRTKDGERKCYKTCSLGWGASENTDSAGTTHNVHKICTKCTLGKFQDRNEHVQCKACPVGYFTDQDEQSECKSCPVGFANDETNQRKCNECQMGYYNEETAQAQCQACSIGKWNDKTQSEVESDCIHCAKGKYQPLTAQTHESVCTNCPTGYYNEEIAQAQCQACWIGKWNNKTQSEVESDCIHCAKGKYQPLTARTHESVCTSCSPGYYNDQTAMAQCKACSPAKWNNKTQSEVESDCIDCAKGKHQPYSIPQPHESVCRTCSPGYYNDQTAMEQCKECSIGKWNNKTQSEVESDCIHCAKGKYQPYPYPQTTESACKTCPIGYYIDETAMTQCQYCPLGYIQPHTGKGFCNICEAGKTYEAEDDKWIWYMEQVPIQGYGIIQVEKQKRIIIPARCLSCSVGKYSNIEPSIADCKECTGTWKSTSVCEYESCDTTGQTLNDNICTCGNTILENYETQLCMTGTIEDKGNCTNTDGTVPNVACTCGDNECSKDAGLFCYGNTCKKHKKCNNGSNTEECICDSTTCTFLTGLNCNEGICEKDECVHKNGLYINKQSCKCSNSETCDDVNMLCNGATCSYRQCRQDNKISEFKCKCGSNTCEESQLCDSNLQCSYKTCKHTLGLIFNSDKCACGDAVCDANSLCFTSTDSSLGSCRTSGHGMYGYPVVKQGLCEDINATAITDASACEKAAERLDIVYNSGTSGSCVIQNDAVELVSQPSCSPTQQCICTVEAVFGKSQACEHTNDVDLNDETCQCGGDLLIGGTICTPNTGLICDGNTCRKQCESNEIRVNDKCVSCPPGKATNSEAGPCMQGVQTCGNIEVWNTLALGEGILYSDICAEGTFEKNPPSYNTVRNCQQCNPGQYQDEKGMKSCKKCTLGTYNTHYGSLNCTNCTAGKFNDLTEQKSENSCKECAAGTFASLPGQVSCTTCEQGKWQDIVGSASCKSCPNGWLSGEKMADCRERLNCTKGEYFDTNTFVCENCPDGKYNDQTGQEGEDSCKLCLCPPGSRQSIADQTTCFNTSTAPRVEPFTGSNNLLLEQGKVTQNFECVSCSTSLRRTYQDEFGKNECKRCMDSCDDCAKENTMLETIKTKNPYCERCESNFVASTCRCFQRDWYGRTIDC